MSNPSQGIIINKPRYSSSYYVNQLFIAGSQNDSAFYGLHRTKELRKLNLKDISHQIKKLLVIIVI